MDKNVPEARNLFAENCQSLLSFYVFNGYSRSPTAATERTTTAIKIPLWCFEYLGFGSGKRLV